MMDDKMRDLYIQGQNRWPGVLIPYEAFRERLRIAGGGRGDQPVSAEVLDRLPSDDIYLAIALGDEAPKAMDHFHRENFEFLRDISRKYARNLDDAEDIAQDLCASIGRRVKKYAGRGSLKGWLSRIAPNVTRDLYRSGAEARENSLEALSRPEPDAPSSSDAPIMTDGGSSADETRDQIDRQRCAEMFKETLASAMEKLTPEQRELVNYRFIQGLTGREVARIRGVQEYTISKHLKKALERLEKRILMAATNLFAFSSQDVRDCLEQIGR